MRQTPKRIVLGAVMMAVALSIAAPAAAGKLDLTLSEFANCNSAGRCRPQRADYESFLAEYAFGLVPKKLAPAETLGYSGFYMGVEGNISVRPTGSAADDRWQRLWRIYLIETDATATSITFDRIIGAEAVASLIDHTYRIDFILGNGLLDNHFSLCTQLASQISLYRVRRSPTRQNLGELSSLIRAHLNSSQQIALSG